MRQLGMICNCLLCDTYFMECIDTIEPKELTKDTKQEKFITLQTKLTEKMDFQSCPTCNELCYDMKFQDFLSTEKETILSPCIPVLFIDQKEIHKKKKILKIENTKMNEFELFEENPTDKEKEYEEVEIEEIDDGIPIYINMTESMKPKWTLAFGLGPTRIELDSSKSGRIYKPFLRQFGLDGTPYQNEKNFTSYEFTEMNTKILKCYQKVKRNFIDQFNDELKKIKPVYDNWDEIKEKVEKALK
eukprot:gene10616-3239_t